MSELENQRMKMAKWNNQRAKNEERGLKNFFRMKEVFSKQSKISCNPVLSDSVCSVSGKPCEDNDKPTGFCKHCGSELM
jgi:hypothetical protein